MRFGLEWHDIRCILEVWQQRLSGERVSDERLKSEHQISLVI